MEGDHHDWANWKLETMSWLQVIVVFLPDEVQEAIGCTSLVELDPTGNKDNNSKGKQLYGVTVGVLSGRALAVARDVKDRSGLELERIFHRR